LKARKSTAAFLAYYLRYWPKGFAEARRRRAADPQRHIYVDISLIFRRDSGTGIQRVVRAMMRQLLESPPLGCVIVPIVATKYRSFRAIGLDDWRSGDQTALDRASTIYPKAGDTFLGLDLSAHLIPRHARQLRWWQRRGVRIALFLYDLLPYRKPEYFTDANVRKFRPWLGYLLQEADVAICISSTVADDLRSLLDEQKPARAEELDIRLLPMGGDILNSPAGDGMTEAQEAFLQTLSNAGGAVLMVGTVEPRKAYDIALDAMEWVWAQPRGEAIRLIIVGRRGWHAAATEERLLSHPQNGRRLHRFDDVGDEYLDRLYRASSGLLMTSHAEGFGLPVLEALSCGLPVLARDLDVFREKAAPGIRYFVKDDPESLGSAILDWLHTSATATPAPPPEYNWRNAGQALRDIVGQIA
jgi:glycosyltransferase involved in cell wall biosynthesis